MPTIHFLHLLPPKMQKLHSEVLKKLIAHFSVEITKINEIFAEKTNFTIKSRVYARRNGLNWIMATAQFLNLFPMKMEELQFVKQINPLVSHPKSLKEDSLACQWANSIPSGISLFTGYWMLLKESQERTNELIFTINFTFQCLCWTGIWIRLRFYLKL